MGLLSNSVSVSHFRVAGDLPASDLYQWASERLARHGFTPIDQGTAELSVGWVQLDDHRDSSFAVASAFWRDHYLTFTLRRDQRRIPSALLRANQKQAESEFLEANPGLSRVPKQKREEIRDAVRVALLARTLPVPSTYDAVWDLRSNVITIASIGAKVVEQFEALFKKSFEGLRLVSIHPYGRAEEVGGAELSPELAKENKANSDAVLDLIRSNRWLGWDFLLWIVYRTMNGSSEYRVSRPGPASVGEQFAAYMDNRVVLTGEGEGGCQKFTAAGPMERFGEVRTALRGGKRITEATILFEKDDLLWKTTLKGEMFHFGSFRTPQVKEERDNTVDQMTEREALFYEKMYVMELGMQMFDSLYAAFLSLRLGSGWQEEMAAIDAWLREDASGIE